MCPPERVVRMSETHQPAEVLPVTQARAQIFQTVKRFRNEGITSEPVIFGHRRKAEAVTLPYEMFQALLPAIEEVLLAETVRARLAGGTSSWGEVLADLRIAQSDIDAVDLENYMTPEDEFE